MDSEKLVFYSALSSQVSNKLGTWIRDSGASQHIIGITKHLDSIVDYDDEVTVEDSANYIVKGRGTCTSNLKFGISLKLIGVMYVPEIKRNLVSISPLEDKGYKSPS